MNDGSILLEIKHDYLRSLILVRLGFKVGTKAIEIISEGKHFEVLIEGDFAFADNIHRHFVIQIDEVIFFLEHVGVMIGV